MAWEFAPASLSNSRSQILERLKLSECFRQNRCESIVRSGFTRRHKRSFSIQIEWPKRPTNYHQCRVYPIWVNICARYVDIAGTSDTKFILTIGGPLHPEERHRRRFLLQPAGTANQWSNRLRTRKLSLNHPRMECGPESKIDLNEAALQTAGPVRRFGEKFFVSRNHA